MASDAQDWLHELVDAPSPDERLAQILFEAVQARQLAETVLDELRAIRAHLQRG